MAVTDLWIKRDGTPTKRHGVGLRYRVSVYGHPAKAFRVKAAARAHELELLTRGPARPAAEVTVGELLPTWLSGKARLTPSAYGAYAAGAGRVRERWGATMVDQVFAHDVQAWVSGLAVERDGASVPASRDTCSKALAALRGSLAIARTLGHIEANPCDGVTLARAERRDARFLTVAEVRALAGHAEGDGPVMVWLLATTGIRVGECCALNVGDVDARRGRLRVRRSKNGTARDVPIPSSVLAMLDLGRGKGEPLFRSERGRRVEVRNWRRRTFSPAAVAFGRPELHVHDLRHTAASLMIRSGATPKDVQRALGHKSASMTLDLYAGHWDDALDGVSRRMEVMIEG